MVELRDATEDDRPFLWELQRTAMRPAVEAIWGWDEAFQERLFQERFATTDRHVVRVDGAEVGVLCFAARDDHLFLHSVALLPAHQGKGLGTQLLRLVLEEGRRRGLPVRLQVLKSNRARRLYERLGFAESGETDTHVLMACQSPTRDGMRD